MYEGPPIPDGPDTPVIKALCLSCGRQVYPIFIDPCLYCGRHVCNRCNTDGFCLDHYNALSPEGKVIVKNIKKRYIQKRLIIDIPIILLFSIWFILMIFGIIFINSTFIIYHFIVMITILFLGGFIIKKMRIKELAKIKLQSTEEIRNAYLKNNINDDWKEQLKT